MRRRMLMKKDALLPEGYTRYRYCTPARDHDYETHAYDTLVLPKYLPRVVMKVCMGNVNIVGLFGNEQFAACGRSGGFYSCYRYGKTVTGFLNNDYKKYYTNKEVVIDVSDKMYVIDGGVKEFQYSIDDVYEGEGLSNIGLFCGWRDTIQSINESYAYIGDTKIYEGDTLIGHLIPCTNPAGLSTYYDVVNEREIVIKASSVPQLRATNTIEMRD